MSTDDPKLQPPQPAPQTIAVGETDAAPVDTVAPTWRTKMKNFYNKKPIQWFLIICIAANYIMSAFQATSWARDSESLANKLKLTELVLLIFFSVDLVFCLIMVPIKEFFTDFWYTFDFVIIVANWPAYYLTTTTATFLRVIRTIRIIKIQKKLKQLVEAILLSLPQVSWVIFLCLMIMGLYAVLGVELLREANPEGRFYNISSTFFLLFQMSTYDDWGRIAMDTMSNAKYASVYFISYIFLAGFIVLNLFTALFFESMQRVNSDRRKAKAEAEKKKKLLEEEAKKKELEAAGGGIEMEAKATGLLSPSLPIPGDTTDTASAGVLSPAASGRIVAPVISARGQPTTGRNGGKGDTMTLPPFPYKSELAQLVGVFLQRKKPVGEGGKKKKPEPAEVRHREMMTLLALLLEKTSRLDARLQNIEKNRRAGLDDDEGDSEEEEEEDEDEGDSGNETGEAAAAAAGTNSAPTSGRPTAATATAASKKK